VNRRAHRSHPGVTVGIPTYNRSTLLAETIESVLAQTYGDFRVVVSDNASDDDTSDVVRSFADERILYLRSDRNIGVVGNFNRLIAATETDFFVLLPDDDLLYPDYLAAASEALERFPTAGIAHTAFHRVDERSQAIGHAICPVRTHASVTLERGQEYLERSMTSSWNMCFSSVMYRMPALVGADGFKEHEEPFSDLPLWMRIAMKWDFAFVARPLAGFRIHDDTVTTRIGTNEAYAPDPRDRSIMHSRVRFEHRDRFLDQACLPSKTTKRLRALSAMQHIVETSGLGAPRTETMRSLGQLVRTYPRIAVRPEVLRLAVANFGGRRLRGTARSVGSSLRWASSDRVA
jgi:glycosyltransferase involved in cell wall biosynthesis